MPAVEARSHRRAKRCFPLDANGRRGYSRAMKSQSLLMILGLAVTACGVTILHDKDIAAPQNYRPLNAKDQWRIEGQLDSTIERSQISGLETITERILTVRINGDVAVQGNL